MAVHLARTHSVQSRLAGLPTAPAVSHQRMRQLIEFIEANLDQPLTLDAMAAQVGISPLYLARAFKRRGPVTASVRARARIERAKELLRNSEMRSSTWRCRSASRRRATSRTG